ncbi:hypothetical protein GCM10018781_62980 [Kitasatospora indigofera]|uniref:Uncharacterized protein n=1 Tax=Kitasatospora indigofera TaxID=67307 RepID=A0A919GBW5_9ACTN|nr:hypothetical protein [Kitasatospora indigofera]GHH81104.1 hypothetical protein GCM10018781_62980 [Kitasatospora indigofera]
MMFFRSKKTAAPHDPHLPALTVDEAERLRELVRHELARRGVAVTVAGDTVHAPQGTNSLFNLAETCRRSDPRSWPQLVEQHFGALANAGRTMDDGAAQLLRGAYLRLVPDDSLPPEALADSFRYARPVATGLLEALALDLPDSVRLLTDQDVARAGLDALRTAGRANLLAEPAEHEVIATPSGATLHSVSGPSLFVASKALVLADLVRSLTGREVPEHGVLFTVPSRHLLVFHPVADRHAVGAVNDLAAFGLGAHQDNPGPLSPRLYWWHQGAVTCLTRIDEVTRTFSIAAPDELMTALRALSA